jgi:hypothetical protein
MGVDFIEKSKSWRSLQRDAALLIGPQLAASRRKGISGLLLSLEQLLLQALSDEEAAVEFLRRMPDVYGSCNEDIYNRPLAAEAYAYIHLPIRYCAWWAVFTELLADGVMPMRDSGLLALDVGAGPGPASYALIDFSEAVGQAVLGLEDCDRFRRLQTRRPEVVMVESSPAMSRLVHVLSEIRGRGGPFGAKFDDFFSLRLARTREINAQIRRDLESRIMDEWDVGEIGAKWIMREDYAGWDQPDRYHLCLISNFLTLPQVMQQASEALKGVKKTLPAGGTIAAMGSPGQNGPYAAIYRELQRQMQGLRHLGVSGKHRSEIDDQSQEDFRNFYLNIKNHIEGFGADVDEILSPWPNIHKLVKSRWQSGNKVPGANFRLEVFRAGSQRMSRRHRRTVHQNNP